MVGLYVVGILIVATLMYTLGVVSGYYVKLGSKAQEIEKILADAKQLERDTAAVQQLITDHAAGLMTDQKLAELLSKLN